MRYTIRAPEPGHEGQVGAVSFRAGVAELDDTVHAAELRYFRSAGYGIEPFEATVLVDVDGDGEAEELPKKSASTEAWRAFAVEHGMPEEQANSMSRDELVDHYHKEEGQ